MRDTARETGVTLTLLDLGGHLADAEQFYLKAHPDTEQATASLGFGPYGMAEHNGHLYVICSEGVGWEVTDDEPLEVDVYVTEHENEIALFPSVRCTLTPAEVKDGATADTVDLADHVRRFGSRLEQNFGVWYRTLTAPTNPTKGHTS